MVLPAYASRLLCTWSHEVYEVDRVSMTVPWELVVPHQGHGRTAAAARSGGDAEFAGFAQKVVTAQAAGGSVSVTLSRTADDEKSLKIASAGSDLAGAVVRFALADANGEPVIEGCAMLCHAPLSERFSATFRVTEQLLPREAEFSYALLGGPEWSEEDREMLEFSQEHAVGLEVQQWLAAQLDSLHNA
jgi:hypothetical protein